MASALSPQNTTLCRICSYTTAIHASATSCHRFHSGIAPGSLKAAPRRNWTHEGSPRTEHQSLPVRIRKSCHALLIPPVCCGRNATANPYCARCGYASRHLPPVDGTPVYEAGAVHEEGTGLRGGHRFPKRAPPGSAPEHRTGSWRRDHEAPPSKRNLHFYSLVFRFECNGGGGLAAHGS